MLARIVLAMTAVSARAALVVDRVTSAADRVTALPGWDGPLKSPMYSGYVEVEGMHVHYLFVECESKPPQDAPVLVWSNGGPGASSMFELVRKPISESGCLHAIEQSGALKFDFYTGSGYS